jgi:hypothetical protein
MVDPRAYIESYQYILNWVKIIHLSETGKEKELSSSRSEGCMGNGRKHMEKC